MCVIRRFVRYSPERLLLPRLTELEVLDVCVTQGSDCERGYRPRSFLIFSFLEFVAQEMRRIFAVYAGIALLSPRDQTRCAAISVSRVSIKWWSTLSASNKSFFPGYQRLKAP